MVVHEVWIEIDELGTELEGCCLAGPAGDAFRRQLSSTARLAQTFVAGSHFEAMQVFHRLFGREPYATEHAWDYEPYPIEWRDRQVSNEA